MSNAVPGPIGVVAHYNLLERLEPAGPGDLFRARDTRLGRTVAVRLLPVGFNAPDALTSFIDKARGLAALSHPNATTLFDVGEHEGRVYLAFEFLKGQSLRSEMGGRAINVRRAIDLAIQMADAVAEAHACGFVHGGLSPDSVVITAKGHAKIPAFALASRDGFASADRRPPARLRFAGRSARAWPRTNARTSTRSARCCSRCSPGGVHCIAAPRRRARPIPHVPKELDEVVLKAVAPNPDSRYQSAAAFAAELRSIAMRISMLAAAVGDEGRMSRLRQQVSRILIMTLVMLLGIARGRLVVLRAPEICPRHEVFLPVDPKTPSAPAPGRFRRARAAAIVSVCTWDTKPERADARVRGSAFMSAMTPIGCSRALFRSKITSDGCFSLIRSTAATGCARSRRQPRRPLPRWRS